MLYEPTTLAAAASALAEAVETYGVDARALFRHSGLDFDAVLRPGARYPFSAMARLWANARSETGDPCIGIAAGQRLRPPALHALGLSWLSSPTLYEGLQRIERYAHIASTALRFRLTDLGEQVKLSREVKTDLHAPDPAVDAAFTIIVKMCRSMSDAHFAPLSLSLRQPDNGHIDQYIGYFRCPVRFASEEDALYFDAAAVRKPLLAGNRELAYQNDRIAERYLATLHPERVQDKVREILLTQLPSGNATQEAIASRLHKSVSTLQRELRSEGVSYRQLVEQTRRELASELLKEQRYALSQIAYLLGFSDQGNFSRAFKRWTGSSPAVFRRTA